MDTEINQTQQEQEQLVAQWLLSTPGFFDRHPELLAQLELANSHSGKAISLQEKQMDQVAAAQEAQQQAQQEGIAQEGATEQLNQPGGIPPQQGV